MIASRLEKHVEGLIELSPTQIQAAKILLDKTISNAPTEITTPEGEPMQIEASMRPQVTPEEWMLKHGLGPATGTTD